MSSFQTKITRHANKERGMTHTQRKKAMNKNFPEEALMFSLLDRNFK
jgi:hypothetical protein